MIGKNLSHFKITAKLGEAGMGGVYLAEDTSRYTTATSPMKNWDMDASGDLFAFIELARDESGRAPIEVLLNWSQQVSSDGR